MSGEPQGPKPPSEPSWKWEESNDGVMAYTILFGILGAGALPQLHTTHLADLPYFISLAVMTIYIGAHRGLTTKQRQQLSIKEGFLAPVFASFSLFAVYCVVKYLPDFSLQTVLDCYFWLLGAFAITGASGPYLRRISGPLGQKTIKLTLPDWLLLDEDNKPITKTEIAPSDILCVLLALGVSTTELMSGHSQFTLNNLIACLIATDLLQLLGLRSFRTAALLLSLMLAYDVFWVFGSPKVIGENVMMTVATSDVFVGPTRILFPRVPGGTGDTQQQPTAAKFQFP